ncbi:uncharacterized protein MEPE_03867 [Melanopsichium pennsylvanicum]|uniref:SRR1-like domain-containing protein n=1 Tax=Melanopsichium pennsylvanicum TaxID=63383 RepID=A0AAJ4XN14_9BASI|nr:uncharacterized protein MEPE_03867 [Melanopsichium pennsylvanicum]
MTESEIPFEIVQSRKKRNARITKPLDQTYSSTISASQPTAATTCTKSFTNTNGTITGYVSSGFTYTARKGGKMRRNAKFSTGCVLNQDQEKERSMTRALDTIDIFVRYLGSEIQQYSWSNDKCRQEKSEDQNERMERKNSFAQRIRDCLHSVWSPSSSTDAGVKFEEQMEQLELKKDEEGKGEQSRKSDSEKERNKSEEEEEEKKKKKKGKAVLPRRIVCLGLGSPSSSRSAQVQLALLLVIRSYLSLLHTDNKSRIRPTWTNSNQHDNLSLPSSSSSSSNIPSSNSRAQPNHTDTITTTTTIISNSGSNVAYPTPPKTGSIRYDIECVAYDPIFTQLDADILSKFDILTPHHQPNSNPTADVTDQDDRVTHWIESYYTSISTIPTLLYMPHCDRDLYEHVLSLNYSTNLHPTSTSYLKPWMHFERRLILLSNVLQNYRVLNTHLEMTCPILSRLMDEWQLEHLPNWTSQKRTELAKSTNNDFSSNDKNGGNENVDVNEFCRLWDKNALRDLAFHWL